MRYRITVENEDLSPLNTSSVWVDSNSRVFDSLNPNFSFDPEVNAMFLKMALQHCYVTLDIVGHVFLNEVFDMLGLARTAGGAVLGWSKDFERELPLWEYHDLEDQPGFSLTFNVDGSVLETLSS